MNIAASTAPGLPVSNRMDAPTTTDVPVGGDATTTPGDPAQDFGQVLSVTVSKECVQPASAQAIEGITLNAAFADAKGMGPPLDAALTDAASDRSSPPDLHAILGGRTELPKGTGSDPGSRAKPTDDAKDRADDVSAQLAMLSQWTGPTPLVVQAPVGEDVTDPAVATPGLPALASTPRAVGAAAAPGPRAVLAPADAASNAALVAVVDPALVPGVVVPATLDVAAFVAGRGARPTTASGVDGATTKASPVKAVDAPRLASSDTVTAAIEKVFNGVFAGTTSTAPDAGSVASPFITQIAAQVSNAQGSLATVATSPTAALREPVATPAWSHELGQAAIRMATDDLQHASLRLNPEHLGPLDVQMRIDNGVAHMQFTAAHADTRAALEGSRATLDQMFGDQGLKLGDWSVGNSSANASFARQFGSAQSQSDGTRTSSAEGDVPESGTTVTMRTTRPLGLVDTFA